MADISLFASSVRPHFTPAFFTSLERTQRKIEVVFAGPEDPAKYPAPPHNVQFKYIRTGDIKPAQCYEIARRNCTGKLIHWTADDAEYRGRILDVAYDYFNLVRNRKLLLSIQTMENGSFFDMKNHSFCGHRPETPRMAPFGVMSREYLNELGGLDARFTAGQYENDIAMRIYSDGGDVQIIGDHINYVDVDHEAKHGLESRFRCAFLMDRKILENIWSKDGEPSQKRSDEFVPYPAEINHQLSFGDRGYWT